MSESISPEILTRIDLAAAFRWAARLGLHESIANHFSAAVSDDGKRFLLNPVGVHFSRIRASDLLLLDAGQSQEASGANAADPTAWYLHAELHQRLPQARCILHTHMPHATALCCLQDFEFLMLDQNACRFHGRIAYDRNYSGMALESSEGARVAGLLDDGKSVLFMGNHGVIVVAPSVAQAFDELYYLEKAAQLQVLALSTGRPLALIPEPVAALAGAQWNNYPTRFSELHFQALKDILDQQEPDYAH
ncbi:MAG TPA: aldolase [Burkholderiaceae bacterium]|nr:aldolase [Burkholderiaceae bacterium]HQZ07600.1 aldolase [Burkholderiaceae bacterium]